MDEQTCPPLRMDRFVARLYRNLGYVDLTPGPRFNVISGDNGQGKSNLLEGLFYLGTLRSFRSARTDDLVQVDAETASLDGRFLTSPAPRVASVRLTRKKSRKLGLDRKRPRSTAQWITSFPMVLFHPGDLSLATGSPELRRHYLDRMLEQVDPQFANISSSYLKALRSRNRLLKKENTDRRSIAAFDEILAINGAQIGQLRQQLVNQLAPVIEATFHTISDQQLPLDVRYRHRVEPDVEAIRKQLHTALSKDLARGFTADGPHGDDLELQVKDRGVRHHASQGQHRMMVLALKVAELEVLTKRCGQVPILLLDDVSSELDRTKNRRFFEFIERLGGQVFLTTTHPEFILLDDHRKDFEMREGQLFQP